MTRSIVSYGDHRPRRPRRQRILSLDALEPRELLAATLDMSFGTGGKDTITFNPLSIPTVTYGASAPQPDGKLVVVGSAVGALGNLDFAIARLNADGSLDTTFGQGKGEELVPFDINGGVTGNNDDIASGVVIQPDGKIVVSGLASGAQIALTRLLPNGDLDKTFQEGRVAIPVPDAINATGSPVINRMNVALQAVGAGGPNIIVAAGNFIVSFDTSGPPIRTARVTFTGNTSDPGTPPSDGSDTDTIINALAVQPDGKIVVAGSGMVVGADGDRFGPNTIPFNAIGVAQFNSDLSTDITFGNQFLPGGVPYKDVRNQIFTWSLIPTGQSTPQANGLALMPDNRIIVVGTSASSLGADGRLVLFRMATNGVIDTSFAGGVEPIETFAQGLSVAYDPVDQKVVAVGFANLPQPEFAIVRTKIDGTIDSDFATSFGTQPSTTTFQTVFVGSAPGNDKAQDVIILPDGRIVVAGSTINTAGPQIGLVQLLTDPPPTVSIDPTNVIVTEPNSGTSNADFTVKLSSAPRVLPIMVNVATADGTATAGSDYLPVSTTLTFAAGVTSITVPVPIIGSTESKPDETFTVNLSSPVNATIAEGQGVGTIHNIAPIPIPQITISDVTMLEGNSGTSNATFTISLSTSTRRPITVNVATADGTATAGSDYTPVSTTVTFAPGVTSQTVTVPIIGDTVYEPDERFTVNLSSPVNATIAKGQGVGTILNDDPIPIPDFVNAQRVLVAGKKAVEGIQLNFTGPLAVNIASQPGFYRVNQGNKRIRIVRAEVAGNSVALFLAKSLAKRPFRVSFGGLVSAHGQPIAAAATRV